MSKAGRLTSQKLSDKAVWRLVKGAAGLDEWERFSEHPLRAGFATAAGEVGADLWRNNPTKDI